ncbi:hypothetical protein [Pseudactinotalea sp.]|uniref:hypothetical protein n=1 Tax=Pseudactinotalea sp. TaxID=1926260 RepID=UPI003B3A4E3A
MNTTSLLPPPRADRSAERRAHLAARWSAGGAALSGVGGLAALVAGLTGHGATSTVTHPALSLTHTLPHHQVAVMLGVAGLLIAVGLLLQGALARAVGRGDARPGLTSPRLALVVAAPLLAAVALAAACDANPLAFLGYLPSVGVGSLFSAEMRASWSTLPWLPMIAQLTVIATAVVSVVTSIRVADALRGDAPRPRWQQPASAARGGPTAVAAAVAIPLLYAFTRIAWVLGWQIGFDADA